MADRFKEYKTYIPPKWQGFDELPAGSIRKRMGFTSAMASVMGAVRGDTSGGKPLFASGGLTTDDNDDDTPVVVLKEGKRLRGSERWAAEMLAYSQEEAERKAARERTLALEEELKRKQEKAIRKRERALQAPTVDGKPMPAAFHALQQTHPREVNAYANLLRTAAAIDQARRREKSEAFLDEKQAKVDEQVIKHLEHIDHRIHEREKMVQDNVQYHRRHQEGLELRADDNRTKLTNDLVKSRDTEHKRLTKREELMEIRRQEQERQRHQRIVEANAEIRRKVDEANQKKAEKEAEFERQAKEKADRVNDRVAMQETHRRAVVDQGLIEKALERAAENYRHKRELQLEVIHKDESKREANIETKLKRDEELHKDWSHRLQFREQRHAGVFETQQQERDRDIARKLEEYHKPVTRSPPPEGRTLSRLQHSSMLRIERNRREDQELEEELQKSEMRQKRVAQSQDLSRSATHKKFVEAEEHRRWVRAHAAELELQFQEETDKLAHEQMQHAEEVARRLEQDRLLRVERESGEKQRRIREALELVNVTKTNERREALRKKEEAAAERHAQRSARRDRMTQEKREADRLRQIELNAKIAGAFERKENEKLESLQEYEARCAQAQAQKDDMQHHRSTELLEDFNNRLAKARAATQAKEDKFLRLKAAVNAADEEHEARLERERKERQEYLRRKNQLLDVKIEEAHDHKTRQTDQWLERTASKLESNYARTTAMSPAPAMTPTFGFSNPFKSPPRAKTTSPGR